MSPILVRPVREQLEHDRVIRLLQARARRRQEVGINPGAEQNVPVGAGASKEFPDVVLLAAERGRKVRGVVEVETGESVNQLEALAQWASYARLKVPFHLYVPSGSFDVARRLCEDHGITVAEFWTYHQVGDQMRFTLVHRSPQAERPKASSPKPAAKRTRPASKVKRPAGGAASKPKARGKAPAKRARASKKTTKSGRRR